MTDLAAAFFIAVPLSLLVLLVLAIVRHRNK